MARSLSSTLLAAVGASTRVPAVTCTIEDHIQHFAQYQTPGNADAWNDACVANDGSIVRVQVTRGGSGFVSNFQFQRVTNPATASQWSAWTTFASGSGNMFQDGGCAISNTGGTLRAFAQRGTGGSDLRVWTSTNNGASWTGPVSVLTPPGSALIKGIGSAGNNDVFFIYDVAGGENVGASFISGGVWSALTTWTLPPILGGAGIAAWWDGGTYTLIYSDGYTLYELAYNPSGGSWTALPQIAPATTTLIGRIAPRLSFDTRSNLFNLVVVEFDTGSISGTVYSYPRVRQSFDRLHWSGGFILHDITSSFGASYVSATSASFNAAYIVSMPTIQRAPNYSASNANQFLDVGGSILTYRRSEEAGKPAMLEMTLDNNRGALNGFVGSTTNFQPLNARCSIVLSEGYKTGSPPTTVETVRTATFHIEEICFERSPHHNRITLIAADLSRNLDQLNRFQMTYQNQTLSWLVQEICARAALFNVVLPGTSQMSQVIPTFIVQSRQSYRHALNELCATYSLVYFLDQNEVMQFRELAGSDPSVWSYQPEIKSATFVSQALQANHVIVTGKPQGGAFVGAVTAGEVYDDAHMHQTGVELVGYHVDLKLTTAAQCALKAGFLLADEQRSALHHQVTIPANPALQLFDPVTLTDYAAPIGSGQSGVARIRGDVVEYDATKALFWMQLDMEGV